MKYLRQTATQHPQFYNAPVPAWGERKPKLLLVGLAPGLKGANRTGKGFVGDRSGAFLFEALHAVGLASHAEPTDAKLVLSNITNVVKCLPPQNQVKAAEVANCGPHLRADLDALWTSKSRQPRAIVALGGVAYTACWRQLQSLPGLEMPDGPPPKFAHGLSVLLADKLQLFASFHPSQQNVNTKRLNQAMLQAVLRDAQQFIMGG